MGRGNQITRQWTIIKILDGRRGSGVTIAELAAELDCSPRTIYRDLDDLQAAGFPLTNEIIDGQGFWQFVEGYRVSLPTPFNLLELMSLYLSRDLLKSLDGTFFYESLKNLIGKIRAELGPELIRFLEATEQSFAAGPGPVRNYAAHREILHLLNDACLKRETVKFRYYSRKRETTKRIVDPYKVYFTRGTLYLVGFDHGRQGVRMFVIDRIQLLEKTGDTFTLKEPFDIEDFLKHSFGVFQQKDIHHVVVRIAAEAAPFLAEKTWHPSQQVTPNPDGSSNFSFDVAGLAEIKSWLLSLGPLARVLEPEALVTEITADLQAALQQYTSPRARRTHSA